MAWKLDRKLVWTKDDELGVIGEQSNENTFWSNLSRTKYKK